MEKAILDVDKREIYRYLGFGSSEPDNRSKETVAECLEELLRAVKPRSFFGTFPLRLLADNTVDFSCFQVRSQKLSKSLEGCERVIFFAATLGTGADRLIQRYSRLEMSRAVILQAVEAAMIEAYCDRENERLGAAFLKEGYFLHPRFSPGYGDFPLSAQRELLEALEAAKRVGITLTDGFFMVPSKSVTAVIGAEKITDGCQTIECQAREYEAREYEADKCEACEEKDCPYRRG